jgi:hypothetical protein
MRPRCLVDQGHSSISANFQARCREARLLVRFDTLASCAKDVSGFKSDTRLISSAAFCFPRPELVGHEQCYYCDVVFSQRAGHAWE